MDGTTFRLQLWYSDGSVQQGQTLQQEATVLHTDLQPSSQVEELRVALVVGCRISGGVEERVDVWEGIEPLISIEI